MRIWLLLFAVLVFGTGPIIFKQLFGAKQKEPVIQSDIASSGSINPSLVKSDEEWKQILTPEQYHILREAGTEVPFTGSLLHNKEKGIYVSAGCNKPLFRSEDKYNSGTGWPSFTKPITDDAVVLKTDYTLGIQRIEVLDPCGGHLGHVFDDGPPPIGKRYCMNSAALLFVPDKK